MDFAMHSGQIGHTGFATPADAAWTVAQVFGAMFPLFFICERFGLNFGYSKFASAGVDRSIEMPSRVGMFLLYFPAIIVAQIPNFMTDSQTFHGVGPAQIAHPYAQRVIWLVTAHFSKRTLEVLFLHKYSGGINLVSVILISTLYMISAALLTATALFGMPEGVRPGQTQSLVGVGVFAVGSLGNLYHHYLLAHLRKPGETGYKLPRGGMFGWICCPHYFFELVAWLGAAIVSAHATGWILLVCFTSYLGGRSGSTLAWYHARTKKLTV